MASELTRENENIRFACCGITRLRCATGNITALTLLRYTSKAGIVASRPQGTEACTGTIACDVHGSRRQGFCVLKNKRIGRFLQKS